MQYIANARLRSGVVTIKHRRHMDESLKRWKDCDLVVTFERQHATRSKAQNDYYYSVVVARIADKWKKNVKDTHEVLKALHLPHDLALNGTNGVLMNGYVIGGSTSRLDKLRFIEYLERIVGWAAEQPLYLPIPDPDPLWREHAEAERAKKETDEA